MSVPVGTVYSRLHGARRQLAKTIARDLKRRQSPAPPPGRLHGEPALGRT
jgi:hypothetical protein